MIKIDAKKAEELLSNLNIPAKPKLLEAVHREYAKSEPDIETISQIITEDVALSASVLKAINSPVYGLCRSITDINQSIVFLGLKSLKTIVDCMMLRRTFSGKASISLERFWDDSVELAQFSTIALDFLNLKKQLPAEDLYAAAMFQDCGIPPMAIRYENYKETLQLANKSVDRPFTLVEDERHSTSHAVVGYFIGTSWYLPKPLCEYILLHHERTFLELNHLDEHTKQIYAVLKLCENVLHKHKRLTNQAEWTAIGTSVLEFLTLSEHDYDDIESDILDAYESW